MQVQHFFDDLTFTLTYVIYSPRTLEAIVIDPVYDFEQAGSKVFEQSYQKVRQFLESKKLKLLAVLETHAHADHITGAQLFKRDFPNVPVCIGEHIVEVQKTFKDIYNLPHLATDGRQFDKLFKDGEIVVFGDIQVKVIHTPGHTPACSSYLIEGHLFTGDALFMPDSGTGRCDFPKGSSKDLYHSIAHKLYQLPDQTKIYVGHDYQPQGRSLLFTTTLLEEKKSNIQLRSETTESDFIQFRSNRDKQLSAPKLLFPSIQVNIDGGKLPEAEKNGQRYLKIPLFNS